MAPTIVKPYVPSKQNPVAIIGDFPYSEIAKQPFSSSHAALLRALLVSAGEEPVKCLQANLLEAYPSKGFASKDAYREGFSKLQKLLEEVKPSAILVLGRNTLPLFKEGASLDDERGFPFKWRNYVCVATYHPRELFVQYHLNVVARADVKKLIELSKSGWTPPTYNLVYQPTYEEVIKFLRRALEERPYLAVDIETNSMLNITCVGFAWSEKDAFTIPLRIGGRHYFTLEQEVEVWRLLSRVVEKCPLVGQNAVHFDHYVFAKHGVLANFVDDTMLAQWQVQPELEKSLAFQASIYTVNPYWKDVLKDARSGKVPRELEFEYNARDCVITYQTARMLKEELTELGDKAIENYKFNVAVSRSFQAMSLRGVRLDVDKWSARKQELKGECAVLEKMLRSEAKLDINVRSPKQMKSWLYDTLKLPKQFKSVKTEDGDYEERESSDTLSLLKLARMFPNIKALSLAGELRKAQKRLSTLDSFRADPKGRITWTFNVVGTETGRASGYKPLDGFGVQPQNVDRRDRDLFLPWEGELWLKADLEGADSWTVAAQCKSCGDDTMMRDLESGLKPAQALAIATLFGEGLISADTKTLVALKSRLKVETLNETKTKGPGRTTYDVQKAVSHGTNYGMQARTMQDNIFKKSDGELWLPVSECEKQQKLYLARYPGILKVHERMHEIMHSTGALTTSNGYRRQFLGRKDRVTLRKMLAFLPQNNTVLTTNLLLYRCLVDELNRKEGFWILRPCNQVHDECDFLFPESEIETASRVFWSLCESEIECWGVRFKIPFEANYGRSWGECETPLPVVINN